MPLVRTSVSITPLLGPSTNCLGICPQRNIHWPELSVLEHGRLWAMMKGGATDPQSLDTLVESCDLSLKKHSPVGTLSGGQMRKVQMLCMLAGGSSICLMDEVTTVMVSKPINPYCTH
jgi:ABC-type multidrug transport system ATPase subunit